MSSTEQSLTILLPSLSDALPPELVSLANSLLAQSRTNAANLKSEEEIARPYACSEIACKRLLARCRLPALRGRPPCPPRVYKKLLAFLEQALPAKLPPKSVQNDRSTTGANGRAPGVRTPTKRAPSARVTTPGKRGTTFAGKVLGSATSSTTPRDRNDDNGAPPWAMPLIRRLCQTFSTPLLPPHVYTGLCVVLKLANLQPNDEDQQQYQTDATALTLALFFLVLSRMQTGKVSSHSYTVDCSHACTVATALHPNLNITKPDIDSWIKRVSSEGWATDHQEWWDSVPEGVFDRRVSRQAEGGEGAGLEEEEEEEEDEDDFDLSVKRSRRARRDDWGGLDQPDPPNGALLPGLGTMMQESVDWLSEDRRTDYAEWKVGIEKRLQQMDGGTPGSRKGGTRRKGNGAGR